jgi:hypothetical protein
LDLGIDQYHAGAQLHSLCQSYGKILTRSTHNADLVWLSTSAAVDIVLSLVLSLELWWARRKLAVKGGLMAKVINQLMVS